LHSFYTSDVIGDILLKPIGIGLLNIEIEIMFLKNFIRSFVGFAKILE
jgi:hypothetical protein